MTHKWIPPPFFVADKEICTMMNKQSVYAHTGNGFFFFCGFYCYVTCVRVAMNVFVVSSLSLLLSWLIDVYSPQV